MLENFLFLTDSLISPELFRKWAGISLIAGALERRVWTETGSGVIYPSLYVTLVAPPAVGKGVINVVRQLWSDCKLPDESPAFRIAPHNMSKASLMDALARSKNLQTPAAAQELSYHSMLIAAEEMGLFMPKYDTEFISALVEIYNCPSDYKETRRTSIVKELHIQKPQLNIIAGAQPGWIASTFPEEAWTMGFASRMIMVYCSLAPKKSLWKKTISPAGKQAELLEQLLVLSKIYGKIPWTEEAEAKIAEWYDADCPPVPTHSKLTYYNGRRILHLIKLAMVAAVSRSENFIVDLQDLERAMEWLFEAEATMPDIFRAMVGRSDFQILEELHMFAVETWKIQRGKPIQEELLMAFLAERCPGDKVGKLLELAEKSGFVERVAGTLGYNPKARFSGRGVE
jgi:hypothetical protein